MVSSDYLCDVDKWRHYYNLTNERSELQKCGLNLHNLYFYNEDKESKLGVTVSVTYKITDCSSMLCFLAYAAGVGLIRRPQWSNSKKDACSFSITEQLISKINVLLYNQFGLSRQILVQQSC